MAREELIDSEIANTNNPYKFFNSTNVKAKLCHKLAKENLFKDTFNIPDVKLVVTVYAAALQVYKNGQLSSVVTNITTEEFELP